MDAQTKVKIDEKLNEIENILVKSRSDSLKADIYALDNFIRKTVDYLIWKRFGLSALHSKLEEYQNKHF